MLRINLLGKEEKPLKPVKQKRAPKKGISVKTIIYLIILLFSIGLAAYTYFPQFFGKPETIVYLPKPKPKIPPAKTDTVRDTTKQVVEKKEPEPKPKVRPPQPKVVKEDYLVNAYFTNLMEINGYSALRSAVTEGTEYTLITVDEENHFLVELISDSKDNIAQYNINLKSRIPEGGIKIIGVDEKFNKNKLTSYISGYLYSDDRSTRETEISFEKFYTPSEIKLKINKIARENGFAIKLFKTQRVFEKDNYKRTVILLKLQGRDRNSVYFVEGLKKGNLNFAIQKISGVPEPNNENVLIAISLEVFVPST